MRVHSEKLLPLLIGQRKHAGLLGLEFCGPTGSRTAAHQKLRIGIVPQPDRVAEFVSYEVGCHVWKVQWWTLGTPDRDIAAAASVERGREGHKRRVSEKHDHVAWQVAREIGQQTSALTHGIDNCCARFL